MSKHVHLLGVGGAKVYLAKDGTYNEAWVAVAATGTSQGLGQYYHSDDYVIYRFTNRVDTRQIPALATIIAADVTFTLSYNDTTDSEFDMVIQSLAPVSATPDNTWFNKEYFSGDGGSVNTAAIVGLITVPFSEAGLALIQKEDYTKIGMRSSKDIAGVAPTGHEYFTYSGYIYYNITFTAVPSVVSYTASTITDNTAICTGKLIQDYDDLGCDKIGICYNRTGMPTVADDKVEEDGAFWANKSISKQLVGLSPGVTYYFRAYSRNPTGYGYGDEVEFRTTGSAVVVLTNISAENNGVFARTILTGEIVNEDEAIILERGFEYLIQDEEPGAGDTGTEVSEIGAGFADGEYSLRNKELYDQQYVADNIVWWFRAYCKDDADNKSVAFSWMKNMPTVTTEDMTSINYNKADGNGLIVSEGASELTMRGFEVIHEFSGRLPDSWRFEIGGFEGEPEQVIVHDSFGVTIIDIYWAGTLIKTVYETYAIAVGAYSITIGRMLFGWPIMQDCLVEGKDYKCKAFAENEFGRVYGEEVDFSTWARTYFSEDPPIVGEISVVKNENIENLPVGITASRRGFRYGTTEAGDEFDVHENGSFTNGPYSMMLSDLLPGTTYYIYAYIVVNGIVYEGSLETITTDAEDTEDSDEYPTPHFSPSGQDYREIETKVFAEVLASQGIIDFSGGKKTLSLTNHLIQTNPEAKTIADNYLNRFKLAKTRMSVSYPTPLPFEREDTIDFSFGKVKFKENDLGVITFKEDGQGVLGFTDQITMIIKQINSVGLIKTLDSIEYVADLDLEHE